MTPMRTQLHVFPTFAMGGAQRRFLQLAEGIEGWRHIVVALDGITEAADASTAALSLRGIEFQKSSGLSVSNILKLQKVIADVRPDILCTYNWGSIEAALVNRLLTRRPHLHFEDGFGPEEADATLPRRDQFRRFALGGKTHLVVPSSGLRDLAGARWRIPAARLHFMANGVDTSQFTPRDDMDNTQPVIGYVGALRREKNVGRLIEAVAGATTKPTLHVVGEGAERPSLEALAAKHSVSAEFLGNDPHPAAAYVKFDLFALSSDTEQMPLTVLEAMACGLAIVATDVGDIRSMVSEDNQPFIVPMDRAQTALPAAIDALLHDEPRRRAIGAANRQRAEKVYSRQTMLNTYSALFDALAPSAG